MKSITRTCLCTCKFEEWFDETIPDIENRESSHSIGQVFSQCDIHQGLSPEDLYLTIKAEDYALRDTTVAIAQSFPQVAALDEDGNVLSTVNPKLVKVYFDENRNIVVDAPTLKPIDVSLAESLIVQPIDRATDVVATYSQVISKDFIAKTNASKITP